MAAKAKPKMVLAYSGGLDTSCILKWNKDKGYNVIAYIADLGQNEDLDAAVEKARDIGAHGFKKVDLKEQFVKDYVFPAIRANAMYEGAYLLGTSLARPLTAKGQVDVAKEFGATVLSHGATGKGNDQVRFENAYATLMPEAEVYAPWKDPEFLDKFAGRDDLIHYARINGIHVSQTMEKPWSSDENMMHISYEAGILEDPLTIPPEDMFQMTSPFMDTPDRGIALEIHFDGGNPVEVRQIGGMSVSNERLMENIEYTDGCSDPVEMLEFLNKIAGKHGVGRVDMVENRYVGMKSRGVYETPGATVLHFAHRDLERITLDREILRMNQHTSIDLAERIYSGFWFSPEREAMQNSIDFSQKYVNGMVRLALYKGNIIPMGRSSPNTLYDEKTASMHEKGDYDQEDAEGFIRINSLRLRKSAEREAKMKK